MKKTEVIMLHETTRQSWVRDASTFALFLALIGIGVWLESSAMQWVGAIIGFIAICGKAIGAGKRMTVSEAKQFLASLEPGAPDMDGKA